MSDTNTDRVEAPAAERTTASLTSRALWLLVGKVLSFVMGIALPLLLVRRVSKEEFGLYKQAFLVIGTAIATAPMAFQMSMYYFLPREPEHRGQVVLNVLLWSILTNVLAMTVLLRWPSLLHAIFNSSELEPFVGLIGAVIVTWGVSSVLEAVVVANQESRLAAAMIILAQFSKTILMLTAVLYLPTVRSLLYAALAQGVVQTGVLLAYVNWRFPGFWRKFDWSLLWRQLSYATPFGMAGILYGFENDYHNYFVSNRFGAASFAIYSIGCLDIPLVTLVGEAVSSVLILRASALQREGNPRELVLLIAKAMRKLALIYFPVSAFLWVCGRDFITGLFPHYEASWPLFAVNLIMLPFSVLLTDPVSRAYSEHRYVLLRMHIVVFATGVALLWPATHYLGMMGAVLVIVASNLAGKFWMAFRMGRVIGVHRGDWQLLGGVGMAGLAAAGAALATALLHAFLPSWKPLLILMVCGVFFSPLYVGAVLLLKIPEPEERDLALRLLRRYVPILRWGEAG